MGKWAYCSAAVSARSENGIVFAAVDGIVTPTSAALIIADSVNWSRHRLAQVVRYDRAVVNMSAEVMFAAAMKAKPGGTPTALVVSDQQLPVFREYSQMHADRGVMKAAFTSSEAAQRWAADQARVRESWGRWSRALAALP